MKVDDKDEEGADEEQIDKSEDLSLNSGRTWLLKQNQVLLHKKNVIKMSFQRKRKNLTGLNSFD